jgi:hypothetical protein
MARRSFFGRDVVYGDPGNDRIFGSRGADRLFDGAAAIASPAAAGTTSSSAIGVETASVESPVTTRSSHATAMPTRRSGAPGSTAIGSIGGSITRGRSRRGSELRTLGIWREHIETDPKR